MINMNKRAKNKQFSRSLRPRISKPHTFEDAEEYVQSELDISGASATRNKWKNAGYHVGKKMKEKGRSKKLYEISDSSDEDFDNSTENVLSDIGSVINNVFQERNDSIISNSIPSTSDMPSDVTDLVNNLLKSNKDTKVKNPSSSDIASNTTDFVDDLLETNKELLNGSYGKSYEDLCKETDQLLASSLELFNENNSTNDPVIYVCTDKSSIKSSSDEASLPIKSATEIPENKPRQACPICLETLGTELPAWSTFCGHVFCKNCIEYWITSQKNCPTCRKRLTIKKIHQLFLT